MSPNQVSGATGLAVQCLVGETGEQGNVLLVRQHGNCQRGFVGGKALQGLEQFITFQHQVAIMVARGCHGQHGCRHGVGMEHRTCLGKTPVEVCVQPCFC